MSVDIGAHSYGFEGVARNFGNPTAKLTVGKFCSAAIGTTILLDGYHTTEVATFPLKSILIHNMPEQDSLTRGPVTIEHDVWIGTNALILSGVTIGAGSIVGAGAVVTKSFPPYSLIVGNPAILKRRRFSEKIIEELLKIQWWHWEDSKILAHIEDFYGPVEAFVEKHKC